MQRLTLLLLAVACTVPATEIATGKMLGKGYDARAFYTQSAGKWVKTYTGPQYRPEAVGRLMNLRIAQAVVHDEWLTEAPSTLRHTPLVSSPRWTLTGGTASSPSTSRCRERTPGTS